ncbi:putative quinone oxidoreductase [Daldinia vernicosa]|uniref:putative quinone oxidoreductase n=1 Tax=Daldinia vernicosa TaxID=114800 RepID=UPI0020077D12|nr:putative quinone oxidoreductase [Daldinia vernicosa]KAI0844716.1 putative quinone oxidoreductase [Daldinia vernicosa]
MASELPAEHRALVLEAIGEGFHLKNIPTPQPGLGNAIVKITAAGILSYHREIYGGLRFYNFPKPIVGGISAIGRIVAVGADATLLKPGQLVYVDCVIHSRDNPSDLFLTAIHEGLSEGSRKLIRDVWRNGYFAEYAQAPLENCFALDEARLCGELGYTVPDILYSCHMLVGFGGFEDINLKPGETIIICPATGGYGGAAVQTAIGMGTRVIAFGRNEKELARLKEHVLRGTPNASIETVKMTGDVMADAAALRAFGIVDAVLDFTPPKAAKSQHVKSTILALRRGGRVSFMGWNEDPIVSTIIGMDISIKGKLMYHRDDIVLFFKMLERGLFPRGKDFVETKLFKLEDWKEALDAAADHIGIGKFVAFAP